ncbi:NUDIX domain-containing protein [Pelagibacterium lacus]|uniref:NUDIX domain-containing protein n=2 Tax=Pelagibacterium lacus TaxID=2282655 RepID=A0A369W2U4_9HYPH|nr:NUDIX domain-containing protein [Pelagibacterium lacus]
MISVDMAGGRFNFRVAGIAVRAGHVLVHRAHWDSHWSLPGGRIELGEESAVALAREIEEELGVTAQVGSLRFVMENFFVDRGRRFHEIGFYYDVTLPDRFPFREDGGVCHFCEDGDARLEFKWVPMASASLDAINFQPARLRGRMGELGAPVHIAHDERAS